ncbi:MAG TPA: neuraminidase-like domain-containing protein [Pyrinomonadaceae bacterium]|nr:neuraminidase-like domain-containing protein [Pyrinomonadaceae bacterium]
MSTQFINDNDIAVTAIDGGPEPTSELPEGPDISIDFPADGARVVGSVPGVTVNLSGSGWTPLRKRPTVTVQLGASDTFHLGEVLDVNLDGTYFWSFTGVTVTGGPITVTAKATIGSGDTELSGTDTLQLLINDVPPLFEVKVPSEGKLFVGTEDGAVITFSGTATSLFGFGPNAVTWTRDNGLAPGSTSVVNGTWSTEIQVPKDTHSFKFICRDILGNSTTVTRNVIVTAPTGILDVTLVSYLRALMEFATDPFNGGRTRITPAEATNLTANDLVQKFHQKFSQLPTFLAKANEPLHQIRLCIEVLRSYLASLPANPPLAATLAVQEGLYRQAAYFALLNQIGTSFDEIRTTPTAPQDKRELLAERLGIALGATRPDNLDALFLDPSAPAAQPNALTEQKLEALFGLVNTTRDPLQTDLTAAFLGWKLEQLLHEWREDDYPLVPVANATPIIDPDLLIKADFKNPVPSDPAYSLFTTRQATVQQWFSDLQTKRVNVTPFAALDAMLMFVVQKHPADLVKMDDDQKQGKDISGSLSTMKLEIAAFNYLVRVSRLLIGSAGLNLLESEWSDVCNILVQVTKKQNFNTWRTQEKSANPNLSLSPNYFQSPAALPFIRSTGLDANGALLPEGAVDPNWTVIRPGTSTPVQTFATKIMAGAWLPNRSSSRWISSKADAATNDLPGTYTYRTSFDLTGFDPTTVQIRMQISVDDELVDVKLNGQSLGLKVSGPGGIPFIMSHGMQISSGFVSGMNTLDLIVTNQGTVNNPTGIQAQLEFGSLPQRMPLPAWRATAQARQEWESILDGRIEQQNSAVDAHETIIDTVEEATLPMLRNALVAGIGKDADWLTQRLLIDVKADGKAQTTRLNQAIETMQSLFFGLRNSDPPADLPLWKLNRDSRPESNTQFDEQWNSIGSYAGWRAAMLVFLYPENLLLPTLRPANQHSAAWAPFLDAVRSATPLTRDAAAQITTDYLVNVRKPGSGFPSELLPFTFTSITEQMTEAELIAYSVVLAGIWGNANETQKRSLAELFFDVPITLALQFQQDGDFEAALDWYRLVYALDLAPDRRRIYPLMNDEKTIVDNYSQTSQWLLDSAANPHQFARTRSNAHTRFTLLCIVRCMLSFADSEFTTDSFESLPRARALYINARDVLDMAELSTPPSDARVKMNPVIAALRVRAEVNLFKLRTQRNIAGMQREVPALTAQPASFALTVGSSNGRPVSAAPLVPTQYRYATLIERAKQLVTIAQQIEASFLASLEKRDAEAYSILKARQDLDLSSAHVTLQDLRVTEAADGLVLAELQQQKAQFQVDHYQDLLDGDLSANELASLGFMWAQFGLETAATVGYTIAAGADGILAVATLGLFTSKAAGSGAQAFASAAAVAGIQAGIQDKIASYERRKEDWQYQRDVGQKDKQITDQQRKIALDQQQVVLQERAIANSQVQQAQATVDFLASKFTNVELYEYMAGILQGVYSYFLQQAAAMARMAQNQLAFERQEATLSFIQADYWQQPSERSSSSNGNAPDRRGMTGSARLLQDIFELDQHAFATNQRKLQLTKTISLAQMAPFEFQRFRETGVLPVAITRRVFDEDFPGHYLRLIRRVRTSVIALIPPTQGIKATLSNTGVSRTTIGGVAFQDVVVRRDPQAVALTSPMNATGLFELDTQPELLLPFEGLGVESSWEFQMPKASNFINYDSIADVLITIEYTALSDAVYRDQVVQQLDRKFSADRAFSFQQQLSDQWYDLHNPEQLEPAKRFRAEFSIERGDFPLNLESVKTSNVVVYFVPEDGKVVKATTVGLKFASAGAAANVPPVGGDAGSERGLLSTRSGSAPTWKDCVGIEPFGKWTLDLSRDTELQSQLAADKVRDMLFVLSYTGRTPAWPS